MKKLIAAAACALGLLATSGGALAGVVVGVNDDAGKYADGAPQFWQTMSQDGLEQNAMTVLWDETRPDTIIDESFIRKSLPAAQAAGIEVVFDVYPMHSQAFTKLGATPAQFAAFLAKLARTFPSVTEYIVMNECNQPRFVNPQFDDAKRNQSARICGEALAAGYDALKGVNPEIFVWGIGLSPRGNDNADAVSNVSTSPVKFLGYLGEWYRQSGRTAPLMDGFDFHPYPIPQSMPFDRGYTDQENASVSNLDRIYQAFYDAFQGTGQKTIGQQAGGGLPVSLNEVGIQTDETGRSGYAGSEASANSAGGVLGEFATEQFQADWYVKMLDLVACDPNVQVVNIFHLVDETDLGAWQSGLYRVGYQPKASASAVAGWISRTGGECTGAQKAWRPGTSTGGSTGGTGGGTQQSSAEQKLQALLEKGVFQGLGQGTAGPFDQLTREGATDFLKRFFGAKPDLSQPSFGDIVAEKWQALVLSFASSLLQASRSPNLQRASQMTMQMLQTVIGKLGQATNMTAGLFACSGTCSPQQLAALAAKQCELLQLCDSTRSSLAASAVRKPVTFGKAKIAAGKPLKLRMKNVRGAKRAYGRYVFVLRLAPKNGAAAAVAIRLQVKKAKPAKATAKPKAKPKAKQTPKKKTKAANAGRR